MDSSGQAGAFCLLDTLFSALADTVVLPFTAFEQIKFGNFHSRLVEEIHLREEARRRERREQVSKDCSDLVAKEPGRWDEPCRKALQPEPVR
jgi:hypothetical protein